MSDPSPPVAPEAGDVPANPPSQDKMELYSHRIPSLEAGHYTIKIDQDLELDNNKDPQNKVSSRSTKDFQVIAPRFSIPADDIHSCYPHPGQAEMANVLPHIILNDPHLPWERQAGMTKNNYSDPVCTPWLGILTFEADELHVSKEDLWPEDMSTEGKAMPSRSATMAWNMSLGTLLQTRTKVCLPFPNGGVGQAETFQKENIPGEHLDTMVDTIFLRQQKFQALFSKENADPATISLENFRYMAHVRNVTMQEGTQKEVGVVISPRCSPLDSTVPKPAIAHLVSLEGIEGNMILPLPAEKPLVGLISLYSWTYISLPTEHGNPIEMMDRLGKTMAPLRYPEEFINAASGIDASYEGPPHETLDKSGQTWLRKRLQDGYSFMRYRLDTGEETTALFRGPLTPHRQDKSLLNQHAASNDGTDFQLIDFQSGLQDVSYQLAWELGRTMAAGDREFAAALIRLRTRIHRKARALVAQRLSKELPYMRTYANRGRIARTLLDVLATEFLMESAAPESTEAPWNKHQLDDPRMGIIPEIEDADMETEIADAVESITSEGSHTAQSTNWSIISRWCVDRLLINGLPSVYLLPSPEFLPTESLRTFYIDPTWLDALLDGALSVGSHGFYTESDHIRRALKNAFNNKVLAGSSPSQIPRWGFILRSHLIEAFPDLQVRAQWPDPAQAKAKGLVEVVRLQHLASDTLLCLFDRTPEDRLFTGGITISQPPHQQHFSVGDTLNQEELVVGYKSLPSAESTAETPSGHVSIKWKKPGDNEDGKGHWEGKDVVLEPVFNWETRCLRGEAFAKSCVDVLSQMSAEGAPQLGMQPSSAMTGLQLNNQPLSLRLDNVSDGDPGSFPPLPRQLPTPAGLSLRSGPLKVMLKIEGGLQNSEKGQDDSNKVNTTGLTGDDDKHNYNFPFPRFRPKPQENTSPRQLREALTYSPSTTLYQQALSLFKRKHPKSPIQPVLISPIAKCLFSLHHHRRSIPVSPIRPETRTDLVLSLQIAANLADIGMENDLMLKRVEITIPTNNTADSLLRVTKEGGDEDEGSEMRLAVIPDARPLGRGQRWLAISEEIPPLRQNSHRNDYPSLRVTLVPRGGQNVRVDSAGNLSVLLVGSAVLQKPSRKVKVLFTEVYVKKGGSSEIRFESELSVEKELI